jgi:hypothetical protein
MDEWGRRLDRLTPEKQEYILRDLPQHLLASGQNERYCRLFMDRSFILARLKIVSPLDVLEDIARAKHLANDPSGLQEWFQPLQGAIEVAIKNGIAGFLDNKTPDLFYSCFISYSHADEAFAVKLYSGLEQHGIRCWLDKKELLPGDDLYDEIDKGIRLWDKVLVCCSESSLKLSGWVDREIDKALQKEERLLRERQAKVLALIPLDLDGYLFRWDSGKASVLKSRLVADFKAWPTDTEQFDEQLGKLISALRADSGGRRPPPTPRL